MAKRKGKHGRRNLVTRECKCGRKFKINDKTEDFRFCETCRARTVLPGGFISPGRKG